MNILEKEFEDVIFDAIESNPELLKSKRFPCKLHNTYLRQVEIGSYGVADMLGFDIRYSEEGGRVIDVSIYELKKEEITASTFFQAIRYAKGIESLLDAISDEYKFYYDLKFEIFLIGKYIDTKSDFIYLTDVMPNVNFYTYHLDLKDGLTFNKVDGYHLTNENFNKNNFSKYIGFLKSVIIKRCRWWTSYKKHAGSFF